MTWYLAVMKNYAGFRGRARRREYWMFVLVNAIIGIALAAIGKLTHMPQTGTFGIGMSRNGLGVFGIGVFSSPILFQAYALATFLPFLAVEIRRLHDTGRTGWWWLFGLIPILGWIVLVIFCATGGAAGDNRYGPDPRAPDPHPAPRPGAGHDDEAQRPDIQQRPLPRGGPLGSGHRLGHP
ncbi:MAG: DUF805 domain-containing protein [Streptosporangiaceae bacterium]|jgi:uncharacterized membrane protein YhaH (DUF805 family)